jgi:hypothetical protein
MLTKPNAFSIMVILVAIVWALVTGTQGTSFHFHELLSSAEKIYLVRTCLASLLPMHSPARTLLARQDDPVVIGNCFGSTQCANYANIVGNVSIFSPRLILHITRLNFKT